MMPAIEPVHEACGKTAAVPLVRVRTKNRVMKS